MSYVSCLCPNPQEDFYCAVFEAAPSGVFALDPEGTILALNAKAAQIFGYSQQELTGRSVAALLPPRYQSKYLKGTLLAALRRQTTLSHLVCMGVTKDGREIPIGLSLAKCHTETGPKIVGTAPTSASAATS